MEEFLPNLKWIREPFLPISLLLLRKREDDTLMQFGYACHQLGIFLATISVPQRFINLQLRLATELT